jgi:hypothetical protein
VDTVGEGEQVTVRYKGFRIALSRSRLCGFAAWHYELTDAGVPAGGGWYTGALEQAVRYAKRAVDNRLAAGERQGAS